MPIAIITQSIISAISIPTEADNINIHLQNGDVVSITKSEWKKGKKESDENKIVYYRNKEKHEILKSDIDHVRYESLDTYDKTADFMEEYAKIEEIDEDVLKYYNTKRHKKSRTSQTFAVGAGTIGLLVNPWFLAVTPLPWSQAVGTMKDVDYQYCVKGKEWKELKKERKLYVKALKEKAKMEKDNRNS
ncbi:hypothetical protein KMW28_21060 [Flammeovirga yaeyamensis]|uniref:Uncharacterized protein n=1 Tax=Flammeovirga yaeyamensis TaxID=367791 RepID=A0AAX1NBT0_9BACT|nr:MULTISPECIES: hypothetical protein [Flammeovirga]ANQ52650.1 hypothetical protein MY04_5318 [Flammeovirga sp. MY04]MBB3697161.1 hypothetical protein [Flammeovirga yaeyamensis]NMF33821.1 hypothetical protein [Flammeovirga yaeyamensis]QWG04915.1 hypothetical protein KMW28_21060 [Flammeovirga yaeyamensis]